MSATADYCAYYRSQLGGGHVTVFRGGQTGAGLGDVLRGIFRFLFPIAVRGVTTFADKTFEGTEAGKPLSAAVKSALGPTLSAVAGATLPSATRMMASKLMTPSGTSTQTDTETVDRSAAAPPPPKTSMLSNAASAAARGMGRLYNSLMGSGIVMQEGGGTLFDGEDGVPTTSKRAREYIREELDTPPPTKRAKKATKKKDQPKGKVYNF